MAVQPEFCCEGGGEIPCQMGCGSSSVNINQILRHLICIIFHHYLPRYPSEYHQKIMFDHSHYQNIHSESQNQNQKNLLIFVENCSHKLFVCLGGRGLFGRIPFQQTFSLRGSNSEWRVFENTPCNPGSNHTN